MKHQFESSFGWAPDIHVAELDLEPVVHRRGFKNRFAPVHAVVSHANRCVAVGGNRFLWSEEALLSIELLYTHH